MKRVDVIRILAARQNEIRAKFAVRSLALFGSVARDEATPGSDVDFLVEFSRPVGLFEFIGLKQYLESLLASPVDLGTAASLKAPLKERVMRELIHVA
jgi:uncharacterized protein